MIGQVDKKNAPGAATEKADGEEEAMAVVVEQKLETPKKASGGEMPPPSSTRSRKARKG